MPEDMNDLLQRFVEIFTQRILEKLLAWYDALVGLLPNFVVAVLVVFISWLMARIARRVAQQTLSRFLSAPVIANAGAATTYYVILVVGLFVALETLQLNKAVTSLLAGAGVVGLAVSFAFQDLATNFVSGLFITVQRPLVIGDLILTNGYLGHVAQIGLRSVTLRDLDGQHVVIPSKDIFQNPLTNFSTMPERRVSVEVGVSYASDLERVAKITEDAIAELEVVDRSRPVRIQYEAFGDSSINFVARFWIDTSEQVEYLEAQSLAVVAIKRAYDAHDITIPFPIRTLDFGIRGGRTLTEMLPDRSAA
jgi:small conductance mechanosensitive channel